MLRMRRSWILLLTAVTLCVAYPHKSEAVEVHVVIRDGAIELNVPGIYWDYSVKRAGSPDGPFEEQDYNYIGCTEACQWLDHEAEPGDTYWYQFDLLARDGTEVTVVSPAVAIPGLEGGKFGCNCTPNPFRDQTSLSFRIPASLTGEGSVAARVTIHDATGRVLRTLHDGEFGRGWQTVPWDGRDDAGREVHSGVYFYAVAAGNIRETGRFLKLR